MIARIVMPPADLESAGAGSERVESDLERFEKRRANVDLFREPRAISAVGHQVDALAIEPALHEGLAEADTAIAKHALVSPRLPHLQIPRSIATDPDVCLSQ
jgi:hypothetical protein